MSTEKIDISKKIHEVLHDARKAKKLTLQKLSEITGVSKGHLSDFENGKTMLGGDKLVSVCRTLDVPLVSEDQSPAYAVTVHYQEIIPEEAELLKYYRQLCTEQKLMIIPMMRGLLNSPTKSEENENRERVLKAAS